MRRLQRTLLTVTVAVAGLPAGLLGRAEAIPNPVATDESTYQAFGRVFPDPQGCKAYGVPDANDDGVKDTPRGISPWAKGRVCADQFLQYEEVLEGTKFLARRLPEFVSVIQLDQAYDNPNYRSAGIPRSIVTEDGKPKILGRDRRPLYLFKVTDRTSPIPEKDREHFAYSLSIHGIERAGVEGGVRAMEDLATWAACELPKYRAPEPPAVPLPACAVEGPFPKKIVETPTTAVVPTAGEALKRSVLYFMLPNPDGWARGQVAPVELEDGSPNTNYTPGFFFQRYNGNGVDLNRDWPTVGYSYKPYSPASEPEVKAYRDVLRDIRKTTSAGRFAGGLDLHGMGTAYAFSYTLLGSGQRDYRKNALTVDTSIRTWQDQTQRMAWSPLVADANANGVKDPDEVCVENDPTRLLFGSGTRPSAPACVADQWGTVIDTIGYQVTGGMGDWIDSPLGLDGVGIDNEMYVSHFAPNIVFESALEQTHIDGNKGLITSQVASMLTTSEVRFEPTGSVGYVENPKRLQVTAAPAPVNPGLPAQDDIDVLLPCQDAALQQTETGCDGGRFVPAAAGAPAGTVFEFDVKGPAEGYWNGGLTATYTAPNGAGVAAMLQGMQLQYLDEGTWQTVAFHYRQGVTNGWHPGVVGYDLYLPAGQVATLDDPKPGRYRVMWQISSVPPGRLKIDFQRAEAESAGQAPIDASSMDFFTDLNRYVDPGKRLEAVAIEEMLEDPATLDRFDSLVVVNRLGDRAYLETDLGLDPGSVDAYFQALAGYADRGGNLVLTDAGMKALPELGVVDASKIRSGGWNYAFQISSGLITYSDPARFPLARDIAKPGAAEQEAGRRQAVEPTPLGYTPDASLDATPGMPAWGVERAAWQSACGQSDCVAATTGTNGTVANLGEAVFGQGTIRIAGALLPDPIYAPDDRNDHRFGLASYALTYTGYEVFENLIDAGRD